jgi:hypothetical protein
MHSVAAGGRPSRCAFGAPQGEGKGARGPHPEERREKRRVSKDDNP